MKWTSLGDSVTGTAHRTRNIPCQDAFCFRTFGVTGNWLVIAVADGAGSALFSEIGATIVCNEFVQIIEQLEPDIIYSRDHMIALFGRVRKTLEEEAQRRNINIRELACTVLLAVLGPDSAFFAQIGDGAIVFRQGIDYRVVFWPESEEYVNVTHFLTDDSFEELVRFEAIKEPIFEVAAFTDGLQRVALDFTVRVAYQAFFGPLFNELRTITDPELLIEPFRCFLDSDRVNQRTDDDKTLVFAVRKP